MDGRCCGVIAMLAAGICLNAVTAHASDPADSPEVRARALYDQGIAQYNLQRYEQAIATFEAAYALSPYPGFLYNIAQSYRLEGRAHCGDALHFYRAYLRAEADIPHREKVEQLAAEMETCAKEVERERSRPATVTRPRSKWPLVLGIGGGVLAAGGVSMLVWAASDYRDLNHTCAPSCDPSRIDGPRLHERIGWGMAVGGGASIAAAFALWWMHSSETVPAPQPHARLVPILNGVALEGAF